VQTIKLNPAHDVKRAPCACLTLKPDSRFVVFPLRHSVDLTGEALTNVNIVVRMIIVNTSYNIDNSSVNVLRR
jgi:hypothetical protein